MSNRRNQRQEKAAAKSFVNQTSDSFQNFLAHTGRGTGNQADGGQYGFNPVTRNRMQMELVYRGSWIAGRVVDAVAQDMTREGMEITSTDDPSKLAEFDKEIARLQLWKQLRDTIKWARLYGGACAFMMIDGQNPETPLKMDRIRQGQFKGLMPLDRWVLQPTLTDLIDDYGTHFGKPRFYDTITDTGGMPRMRIHYSRLIRIEGVELPYWQRIAENLWGQSVIERMWDRLLAYDSATAGVAQMLYKAHLRVLSVEGLREIIGGSTAAMKGLLANINMIRTMQSNEGLTLLDTRDKFESHQYAFGGLDVILAQFGEQLAGAVEIPLVRLFGQSPSGFSTGESDIRAYYDSIKQQQVAMLADGVETVYRLAYVSKFGTEPPKEFALDFKALWQMSDAEKSTVTNTTVAAVGEAFGAQIISKAVALKELKALSHITGCFSNITDEDIDSAESLPDPTPEALGLVLPKPVPGALPPTRGGPGGPGGAGKFGPSKPKAPAPTKAKPKAAGAKSKARDAEFFDQFDAYDPTEKRAANGEWVIENTARPGHLWNPAAQEFKSLHSGEYKTYRSEASALQAATRIAKQGVHRVKLTKHRAGRLVDATADTRLGASHAFNPTEKRLASGKWTLFHRHTKKPEVPKPDGDEDDLDTETTDKDAGKSARAKAEARVPSGEHGGEWTKGGAPSKKARSWRLAERTFNRTGGKMTEASVNKKGETIPPRLTYGAKHKYAKWHATSGPPITAAERKALKALFIPPAHVNVRLNPDMEDPVGAVGEDIAGRPQNTYRKDVEGSTKFAQKAAATVAGKFARIKRFHAVRPKLLAKAKADMFNEDLPLEVQDAAAITYLMGVTGFRPGSKKDTKGASKAYGATTLEGRHVTLQGNALKFSYVGKHGVRQKHTVTDPAIVKLYRESHIEHKERWFSASDNHVRQYVAKVAGKGYVPKDLRTWMATATALKHVAAMPKPKNDSEHHEAIKTVAMRVSKILGNEPGEALRSYIDPAVFEPWGGGGPRKKIKDWLMRIFDSGDEKSLEEHMAAHLRADHYPGHDLEALAHDPGDDDGEDEYGEDEAIEEDIDEVIEDMYGAKIAELYPDPK